VIAAGHPEKPSRLHPIRVAALALLLAGCTEPDSARTLHARASDILYSTSPPPQFVSTATYPHRTLDHDRRVILEPAAPSADRVSVDVQLPSKARLEFAYGLAADPAPGSRLELVLTRQGSSRTVWSQTLPADEQTTGEWQDVLVDLEGYAGKARLEFRMSVDGTTRPLGQDVVFADIVITRPTPAPSPPNLILISLDTLRASSLGMYGYERPVSPGLDRIFSTEGVIVERHIANAADTLFGHTAIFTAERPDTALIPDAEHQRVIADWLPSMTDILRANGYRTAAFTENAYVGASYGFSRGFERYVEITEIDDPEEAGGHIETTFGAASRWIDDHRDDPFFVFIHTYEVHTPYNPPAPYRERFAATPQSTPTASDRDLYDAEIAYTDEQTTRLLEHLKQIGVLDRSLLVVTSDHGEEFGEHGARYHGCQLHDEVIRVPLLMRAPGILPAGVRRSGQTSQVDLMPTLLDLLEIPRPVDLTGRSAAEHLRSGEELELRDIFSEARGQSLIPVTRGESSWISPSFGVTRGHLRLIQQRTPSGLRYELYDLSQDPAEQNDVYAQRADEVVRLRRLLERYRADSGRRRSELRARVRTTERHPAREPRSPSLDEERKKKLEALGYLD
jgi:arylsulfatase A-like enzyme